MPRSLRHGALLVALALTVAACADTDDAPFGTAEVTVEPVAQVISTPATVVARTYVATVRDAARVDVLAPGVATVAQLTVADGDVVAEGERIGNLRSDALTTALRQAESAYLAALMSERDANDTLDRANEVPAELPSEFTNRIEEVEIRLAEAQEELARLRRDGATDAELRAQIFVEQGLRTEYDRWVRVNDVRTAARAARVAAEQALEQSRAAVADLTLVAPVSGTVRLAPDVVAGGGRTIGVGSDVAAGQPVLTVIASGGYRVDLAVPEAALAPVTVGTRVDVDLEAFPGTALRGRVDRIVGTPVTSAAGTSFIAEVSLDDTAGIVLRDGLTGTATLPELAFTDRFEVRLEVDEVDVVQVATGQQVSIELDALRGQPLEGTVVALAATPDRSATGATIYRARVRLDTPAGDVPPLRGGLTGTGDVEVQRLDAPLTVPSTALLRSGRAEVVYVVRGGVAVEVPVRVLAFGDVRAAVEGDLRAGERVVTIGVERVEDGTAVEVG